MTIDLFFANMSVTEGDEFVNGSVQLTGSAEREVTVLIHTQNGTATGNLEKCLNVAVDVMCCSPSSSQ